MSAASELVLGTPAVGTSWVPAAPAGSRDLDGFAPIGLDEVARTAALQSRTDAKYLLPADRIGDLLAALAPRMRVLEVDERRGTDYGTTYFDTPELSTYRAHLQRRRRRYKVRTRSYGGGLVMLEVKAKEARGGTAKRRVEHPGPAPDLLGDDGLAFVDQALCDTYGLGAPAGLAVRATTTFHRVTLVDPDAGERLTIDRDLVGTLDGRAVRFGTDHLMVEVKAATWRGHGHRAMRGLGMRPRSFSKYCLTVGALRPDLPHNPWRPVLRTLGASVDCSTASTGPDGVARSASAQASDAG